MINKSVQRLSHGLLALLLSVLIATPAANAANQLLDRVVAIVDEDIILQSELERRSAAIRQQLTERNTQLPDAKVFTRQVLDKLIIDRIQLRLAAESGINVSDNELNNTLERIAESNQLSLTQFKLQLEAEGQNYLEVRDQIRSEMLISQVQNRRVNQRIHISEQEVKNFLTSEQGRKSAEPQLQIAHIMIPLPSGASPEQLTEAKQQAEQTHQQLLQGDDFATTAIAVSKGAEALQGGVIGWRKPSELPEAAAAALQPLQPGQLTEPFRMGGGFHILKLIERRGGEQQMIDQTRVRHILISPSEIRSAEETEQLSQDLYHRLNNGDDFAILAKRYSDDAGSGSNGGDLGWTMAGQMVAEFEQTVDATTTGAISAPFQSQFGWHILQVLERRQQDFGLKILYNEAREVIRKRKFAESLSNWLREIQAQAYIEIKS